MDGTARGMVPQVKIPADVLARGISAEEQLLGNSRLLRRELIAADH
jgi:hypothetical protein